MGKASDAAERAPGLNAGKAIDPRQGIAATTFYDQIKRFFEDCASVLRGRATRRVLSVSPRQARTGCGTRTRAMPSPGMPIEIAQQNLGHASLATTTVYVTTEKRRRMKAIEAFLA